MMASAHMDKYGTTEEDMAFVSVKNHYHASLNSHAQFTSPITTEKVLQSPVVAAPLKLLDCSPISDGAAAVILSKNNKQKIPPKLDSANGGTINKKNVYITASAVATDTLGLAERKDLTTIKAAVSAAKKAYQMAKINPADIDIAEVHDCFSIAEIIAMEDLGFFSKGKAASHIRAGVTKFGGKGPIVNTSGGLKACGHPVGATGVKQIVEIYKQLKGMAEKKQVTGAKTGLTHNVGGSGATAVVHILASS